MSDNETLQSPAFLTFEKNRQRLGRFMEMATAPVFNMEQQVERLKQREEEASLDDEHQQYKIELANKFESVHANFVFVIEWYCVMLVTLVETYLHDVLVYYAGVDNSLMNTPEHNVGYDEVGEYRSIKELQEEMRSRWAKNFIGNGGPQKWIARLIKMGASQLNDDTMTPEMEELWGVRHLIVHRAGIVTRDFCSRHPSLSATPGTRLEMSDQKPIIYTQTCEHFCDQTEEFFGKRYASVLKEVAILASP